MKNINLIILVLLGLFLNSCTEDFDDMNTREKQPAEVEGEFLFSNAEKELMDQISNTNVNSNVWKLFAQNWTETTYTDEANYDIVNRTIADNAFDAYYRLILNPLKKAKELIEEDPIVGAETDAQKKNKTLIIDVLEVYAYANLVDIFGNVPYSEAVDVDNISPVYDDAYTIYTDLLARLKTASDGFDGDASFGDADLIYGGSVSAWKKFTNSLRVKIAIHMADAKDAEAKTVIESAIADGVFTSAADNALFDYQGSTPNTNPLHEDLVLSGRSDFVAANTIVDLMNGLTDPRMDYYFSNKIDGAYLGGNYGASSAYSSFSHVAPWIESATFPGILMTYSEVMFYLAEAAERGYAVGVTAEDAYNAAITASFDYWSTPGVDAYLAQENVAYTTATGDWREKIGTQSYISFYTRGFISYTQYRRLDFPAMNVAPAAATTDGSVPARFTYPVNEQTLNADNYAAAAEAIGGDNLETKLFWDVN